MALPNLAAQADLTARGVAGVSDTWLAVASSLVREAAGSPILSASATVSWWATERGEQWLSIPVTPVRSISSLTLDGSAVTDYRLVNGDLWRHCGWSWGVPLEVEATLTVGLPDVPEHIRQLVCDLAILGANTATAGALDPRVVAESIDDYSVRFADSAAVVASAMSIPKATRLALRRQFGRGVAGLKIR
ncbi:hypothetical protein [Nocardioides sp.]|uniref:hypothetical protein n=1 Tax=Nocardioides sp. TaxID=35761 RepID=UPI003510F9F1